jgi:hypothetical protein
MKDAQIGKVYNYTFSFLVTIYVCNVLSFPLKSAEQETTQFALLFHSITRRVPGSIKIAKATPHKSNIISITIRYLWTAMNFCNCSKWYQLHEFQVRIFQFIDKLAIEVMHKHKIFEPPEFPTHTQTGKLTASPVVPCSWNRHCITTLQS